MTPYEQVASEFALPLTPYPYQIDTINKLAPLPRAGYWLDPGTGKTLTSTISCLHKHRQVVVLAPPILGVMWVRFLRTIPGITVAHYAGAPKVRSEMDLNVDFLVMSIQIFKRDYDSLVSRLDYNITLNIDECTSVKGLDSDNHRSVVDIMKRKDAHLLLLSGTPISAPEDSYAYSKLLNTGAYRNFKHWCNVHVESYDFFGNIAEYKNLDLMYENMKINSVRVLKEDVLKYLPTVTFVPLVYQLDPAHARLYRKLAEEELLELESSGGKIDATATAKLYHALGQIVVNWGHFADDDSKVSKAVDVIEEVLEELGDGKLVVFTNYRLTSQLLAKKLEKYNSTLIYGGIGNRAQQEAITKFATDPTCRVVVAATSAAGLGIDSWQHICSNVLFVELPTVPAMLNQALSRIHRNGQQKPVTVYLATAQGTLQVKQMKRLTERDTLVNRVIRNARDLRDELLGVEDGAEKSKVHSGSGERGRRLEGVCAV